MDKKLKIAYLLTGIVIVGQIYLYGKYVDYFIAPISILLLLLSIIGSIRARLALIGFLLYYCFCSFISIYSAIFVFILSNDLNSLLDLPKIDVFVVITPILYVVTAFLFKSINTKETISKFSERTPLKLISILFIVLAVWITMSLILVTISDWKYIVRSIEQGLINSRYFVQNAKIYIYSTICIILYVYIAFSIHKQKAIGFILAPTILIMSIIIKIQTFFSNYRALKYFRDFSAYKDSFDLEYIKLFEYYFHCIVFPLFALPLVFFFIFCLKEDTLGIVTTKLKYIKGNKNEKG